MEFLHFVASGGWPGNKITSLIILQAGKFLSQELHQRSLSKFADAISGLGGGM